jgi:hypothetical protein
MLLYDKSFYDGREKIIEETQKNGEAQGYPDHDGRKAYRLLARRPVYVAQFLP